MELENSEKINTLISLSNHAYDETKRYRDQLWKILIWIIGLLVGILTVIDKGPAFINTCNGKWLASIFIVFVASSGVWNIFFAYKQFVWNRNLLRECERKLQFHKKGTYGENSLLPEKWETENYTYKKCFPHFFQYIFVIIVIAGYCIYMLWSNYN